MSGRGVWAPGHSAARAATVATGSRVHPSMACVRAATISEGSASHGVADATPCSNVGMTRRRRIGQKGHDHLPCGDESIGGFASLGYAQGEKHRIRIARLGRRGESASVSAASRPRRYEAAISMTAMTDAMTSFRLPARRQYRDRRGREPAVSRVSPQGVGMTRPGSPGFLPGACWQAT